MHNPQLHLVFPGAPQQEAVKLLPACLTHLADDTQTQSTECSITAQDLAKAAERMVLDPQLHLVFLVTPQQEADELLPACLPSCLPYSLCR